MTQRADIDHDAGAQNLWRSTAARRVAIPTLDGVLNVDVLVIGGGFTGVSAAYHLACKGVRVCLLEARRLGHGGSGRNVGLVNAGLWTPPEAVKQKLGPVVGRRLNDSLAVAPELVFSLIEKHQIQCEPKRIGTLHCAHSSHGFKDLEDRYAQQMDLSAPVELLNASETEHRTGSKTFHGALLDKRAGTIQPLGFVIGLAEAALSQGAQIFEMSPVVDLSYRDGMWRAATPSGAVHARKIIQATNAYGEQGAPTNPFIPAHYFQLATDPLPNELREMILPEPYGCWDTALIMSSFRMDEAGRLILGALGNLESFGRKPHMGWAKRKLMQLFPQLDGVKFNYAWSGQIAMTSDYLPRVQCLGPDAVSIFGYSGRGIGPGTLFGKCAAEWASEENDDAFPIAITEKKPELLRGAKAMFYETGATLRHFVGERLPR